MDTSQPTLVKAGLGPYESEIYTVLTEIGESLVPDILKHTSLSRATVYEALTGLLVKNLVEYRKDGRHAYYAPVHPSKLLGLIDERKRELNTLEEDIKQTVEGLTASYNIANKKPGVRFFVGQDMAEKIFLENLDAKEPVYSITNRDAFEDMSAELLETYLKKKKEKQVVERVIVVDSPKARDLLAQSELDPTFEVKTLPMGKAGFLAGMDIYDGKIIYGTHKQGDPVTVLIEDPELCRMQRELFEVLWGLL